MDWSITRIAQSSKTNSPSPTCSNKDFRNTSITPYLIRQLVRYCYAHALEIRFIHKNEQEYLTKTNKNSFYFNKYFQILFKYSSYCTTNRCTQQYERLTHQYYLGIFVEIKKRFCLRFPIHNDYKIKKKKTFICIIRINVVSLRSQSPRRDVRAALA